MMSLWLALAGLFLLALLFVGWPLWRYKLAGSRPELSDDEISHRLAENVRIFHEHLLELENSRNARAIDEQQFNQLKLELQRNLLADEADLRAQHHADEKKSTSRASSGIWILLFSALVLIAGVAFYQKLGSAKDVALQELQEEKTRQDYQDMVQNRDPDPKRAQQLEAEYQERLKDKPDSLQYWYLLARTQLELGEYAKSVESYQQILNRDPQSPVVMAEMAQAMFLANGNIMNPPIADLAKSALALDPQNTMALGLLGIDAYSRKDYKEAIRYWKKTVEILGPNADGARALASGIEKAKQAYVAEGGKLEDLTAKSPYTLQLKVSLGANVKAKPSDAVFVYARAWKGSPMPLAISRLTVADLPKVITLDETMAMSPMASLATAADVEVVARVSPAGSAQAKAGDWQAKQGPISMKSVPSEISLEVNTQLTAESLATP